MLDLNITELDIGTKARNRAFQERLDEIWRDTMAYESKLKAEAKQAAETILNMREDYAKHINEFKNSILSKVNTTYDKVDNEGIPEQSARVDVIEKDLEFFIKTTVPDAIEKQSGEVSRQLKRLYENFGIEQEKERKRETKLVGKANAHLTNTAQRFMDENALMSSCFFTLEDDIVEHEQRAARMHLLRNSAAFEKVKKLNAVAKLEAVTRTEEDVDVLSTVIETQQLLQQTVSRHHAARSNCNVLYYFHIPRKLLRTFWPLYLTSIVLFLPPVNSNILFFRY